MNSFKSYQINIIKLSMLFNRHSDYKNEEEEENILNLKKGWYAFSLNIIIIQKIMEACYQWS